MNFKFHSFNVKCSQKLVNLGHPFCFYKSDPKVIDILFFAVSASILFSSSPCFSFILDVDLGCHQLSAAGIHTSNMDEHGAVVSTMIALNLATRRGIVLFKSNCLL